MKRALYLDDVRTPVEELPDHTWIVVRNFDQFKTHLDTHGIPDYISFDHDLHEEHMSDFWNHQHQGILFIDYGSFTQKTGMDCAAYFIETANRYAENIESKLTVTNVHSANPIGTSNLVKLLEEFIGGPGQPSRVTRYSFAHIIDDTDIT